MNKILIIGIVASGKTTLAKKLSIVLEYPFYELDQIAHNCNEEARPKRSEEEQLAMIYKINNHQKSWIFEGVYRPSQKKLYDIADTIIFLDMPLGVRKRRICLRFIKQKLRIEKCHYKSDIRMLKFMFKWTNDFELNREVFEEFLLQYRPKLVWLKKTSEVKNLLKQLSDDNKS